MAAEIAEPPPEEEDPDVLSIRKRLLELVSAGEFSLAWHLERAAGRLLPGINLPIKPTELEMAAIAGRINHAAPQIGLDIDVLLANALEALPAIGDDGGDASVARALRLFVSGSELAMFQANHTAIQVLEGAFDLLSPDLKGALFPLKDAIGRARVCGVAVSPAMLRAATNAEEAAAQRETAREAIAAKIDQIRNLSFSFVTGIHTCTELCKPGSAIGQLKVAAETGGPNAIEVARAFAHSYSSETATASMVVAASREVSARDTIDGPARVRLVGHVLDLAAICSDFVAAAEALPETGSGGRMAIVQKVRTAVKRAADAAVATLEQLADPDGSMTAASASAMLPALQHLVAVVEGSVRQPGQHDGLAALHGCLLLIPALDYGRGWMPAPYNPSVIVDEIMNVYLPLLRPMGHERNTVFYDAVQERIGRGSFGGALFAVGLAGFFEIGEQTLLELVEDIEAQMPIRQNRLEAAVEAAYRRVERVQRLGEGATMSECDALLTHVSMISKAKLPVLVDIEARTTEEEASENVLDFSSAEAVLEDIQLRARNLLAEPMKLIVKRLAALEADMDPENKASFQRLLEDDDLITARERLDIVERGERMPTPQSSPNPRFAAFFPRVPDFVSKMSGSIRTDLPLSIADGTDVGPLEFSRIADEGRAAAKDTYDLWRRLPRHFTAGDAGTRVIGGALDILRRFNFVVKNSEPDKTLSKKMQAIHVSNVRLEFPSDDAENMLLPDYGSRTEGNYRLVVTTMMPAEGVINDLSDSAGITATIIARGRPC